MAATRRSQSWAVQIKKGTKFGLLVVIDKDEEGSKISKSSRYFCKCVCGEIKSVLGSSLKRGSSKSCGLCHRRQTYGAVKEAVCYVCGSKFECHSRKKIVMCSDFCRNERNKIAGRSRKSESLESAIWDTFKVAMYRATKRALEFDIDYDFLTRLIAKQNQRCALSGMQLAPRIKDPDGHRTHPYAISIDRIDSSKGYTKENVRLVCHIANLAKNVYSDEEFLKMCREVVVWNGNS